MIHKNPAANLRGTYKKSLEAALALSLLLVIAAFKFFPDIRSPKSLVGHGADPLSVDQILPTRHSMPLPPPSGAPIVIEAPKDQVLEDVTINSELNVSGTVPPPATDNTEESYFVAVEELPRPMGGIGSIQAKIVYPEMAKRVGIEGLVVVLAYVDETGIVTKTELLKGIGLGCDEEAMKAVKETRFLPGMQRGKAVKVKVSVPVRFRMR